MTMAKKREEELIELVFGDLPQDRADRLHQAIDQDPELRRAYDCYQEMREDLASMREVPDDQLSVERLRHAILARGLEERKTRRLLPSWTWMPASSMALAAVLVAARGWMPGPDPKYVADTTLAAAAPPVSLEAEVSKPKPPAPAMVAQETAPQVRRSSLRRGTAASRARTQEEPVLVAMNAGAGRTMSAAVEEAPAPMEMAAPVEDPVVSEPPQTDPPAVVLIQDDGSEGMGAMRAVEMESLKHVVVGG